MKTWVSVLIVTAHIPYFLLLALWESVLLKLGISILLFEWHVIRRVSPDSRVRAYAMYLSIGWLMVSPGGPTSTCIATTKQTTCRASCTSTTASTCPS
jgi:thiol:disulfide interchange protein